jgi:hypothetical protein
MKCMQCHLSLALAAALLALVGPARAQAPLPALITVDENGNGTVRFPPGPSITLPASLQPDPGPGGLGSVLTYDLLGPPSLVAGDVFLNDGPPGGSLDAEDVVRFNPAGTGGNPNYPASLVFYSDSVDGFDSLADTPGPPNAFYDNQVIIPEVGTEAGNGAVYTPLPGQPGFINGFIVTYDLSSDVPEPGALSLLFGVGLSGLCLTFRRLSGGGRFMATSLLRLLTSHVCEQTV